MNSIIICEGNTDLTLIQYYMEVAIGWKYQSMDNKILGFKIARSFIKNDNTLLIGAAGGCSKIKNCFEKAIIKNTFSKDDLEAIQNIIIIGDRDELNSIEAFSDQIKNVLSDHNVTKDSAIVNDKWVQCKTLNGRMNEIEFRILLLAIPFDETGALETFLLKAVARKDTYDEKIIIEGNKFVENIDPEQRYLKKRRYKTKANFDVYFSIRTPIEQFGERRDILKGVNWEDYEEIQQSFKKLREL